MTTATPAVFITLEGGEGSGKSTQLQLLQQAFESAGLAFDVTREPGGTTGAESIRKLLVEGEADAWDPVSETVLFMAARISHVRQRILPALKKGTHIICDRFMDSTLVYQGMGKQVGLPFIEGLHNYTLGNLKPDLTLLLDIDPEQGLARAAERGDAENRFEEMDLEFHQLVRAGFLWLAEQNPQRIAVIDASEPPDQVHQAVREAITQRVGITL